MPKKKKKVAKKKAVKKVAKKKVSKSVSVSRAKPSKIHFTEREVEVFRLASLGCTVSEIADILKIAPSTADNHKSRVMMKLGTDKAALLTRLAIQHGISGMDDTLTAAEKRKRGRRKDGWN